jgi:hypothetical protein
MEDRIKCLGCGKPFWPSSAKQTHYCSSGCGDRVRNHKKRDRRLALLRNIEILDALRIPVGHSMEVNLDDLCAQDFDPDAHTDRVDFWLSDGITQAVRIYMQRYLIYNRQNKITIQHM